MPPSSLWKKAAAVATRGYAKLHGRVGGDREWFRNLTASLIIAAVSIAILLAYRRYDPDKKVEHYYRRENHVTAHRVLVGCTIVIMASAAFNMRFVIFEVAQTVLSSGPQKN